MRVLVPQGPWPLPAPLGSTVATLAGDTMGTTWQVRVAAPAGLDAEARLRPVVAGVLGQVIAQMSAWEPDSDLNRFARAAPGAWVPLPEAFAEVMRCALHVAERSGGAYDPSAAPLVAAWGFGPQGGWQAPDFEPPRPEDLADLSMGWAALQLDATGRLRQPGAWSLDLNAVAKGHAVDAVADALTACGLLNHLVEIGGELRGSGLKPNGHPWWVAVEAPAPESTLPATRIGLSARDGLAIATSGDYRRRFRHADREFPHTLDPRTRQPVRHGLASVTVLHARAMWADAWSTALMVLGPTAGLERARAEGLAALLQWRDPQGAWVEASSPAFDALLAS